MLQDIVDCFIIKKYKQNDTIVRVGQFVNEYFFIAEGSIRIVLETEEKDITAWLIFENNFFTDLESIKTGQGSKSKIVALEDTTLCLIHTSKMHQMYKKYPEWQEFGRLITEDALLNIIDTLVSFQVMDAQERYIRLLHKSDVIQRVPLKLLASYLGITPTSLSRIRKSVSTI